MGGQNVKIRNGVGGIDYRNVGRDWIVYRVRTGIHKIIVVVLSINMHTHMGDDTMMRKFKLLFVTPLVTLSYWLHDVADDIYMWAENINDHNVPH